jgi:hypothetical protein
MRTTPQPTQRHQNDKHKTRQYKIRSDNINLEVGLGLHACRRRHKHELCKEIDDQSNLVDELVLGDRRQDVAEAREELNAVVKADDTVVAWIRLESVGVHHVQTSGGDRQANAAIHLEAQA